MFCNDPNLRKFCEHHMETEQKHLNLIEEILPKKDHSKLLPIWRVAGVLTGALPALLSPKAVYATIAAVETYVDHHYQDQIDRLEKEKSFPEIKELLETCQKDEVQHRDEALEKHEGPLDGLISVWAGLVSVGSKVAVCAARKI